MSEEERSAAVDEALAALVVVMDDVPDPRGRQGKRHLLTSVLTIAVLGCLCAATMPRRCKTGRRTRSGCPTIWSSAEVEWNKEIGHVSHEVSHPIRHETQGWQIALRNRNPSGTCSFERRMLSSRGKRSA